MRHQKSHDTGPSRKPEHQPPIASKPTLLLVEDDARFARSLTEATSGKYHISAVESAEEALDRLSVESYDAVLLDLYLRPGLMDGFEFLERALEDHPSMAIVLVTMEEKADAVLSAMKRGAWDYAPKSLSFSEISERVDSCLEKNRLLQRTQRLEQALQNDRPFVFLDHPLMRRVEEAVRRAASVDSTVLLQGETGTGKTVLARSIHSKSSRRDRAFVTYVCAETARTLMESELFGALAGAYTGAVNREGLAEAARGGTLFIDELDKLEGSLQGKLLRLIDEREVRRVGSTRSSKVDVRIIGASSRDLEAEVREGRFKQELLSRFDILRIELPALREMKSVIPELARFYMSQYAQRLHKRIVGISPEAIEIMQRAQWPGNVRELRNAIERAVIYCDGMELMSHHLPERLRFGPPSGKRDFKEAVQEAADQARRQMIREALSRHAWNVRKAAEDLDVTPQALRQHMSRLGIAVSRPRTV